MPHSATQIVGDETVTSPSWISIAGGRRETRETSGAAGSAGGGRELLIGLGEHQRVRRRL